MKKCIKYFFVIIVFIVAAHAQTAVNRYSTGMAIRDSSGAALRFERNVNTYLWNANAHYRYDDDDLFVALSDRFTSSFIRSQFRSFRDEQNFSFSTAKRLSSLFSVVGEAQSFILSDNQTLGNSNAGIHTGVVGLSYRPLSSVSLTPMIGMRYDKQQLERDAGPNYRLIGEADSIDIGGYRANAFGHLNYSGLGNRTLKNNAAEMTVAAEFTPGSTDSLRVRWLQNRNDFYIPADIAVARKFGLSSNIRSRAENLYGVQNILRYDVGARLGAEFTVNLESRSIDNSFRYKDLSISADSIPFNTSVSELRLEGGVNLRYLSSSTMATAGIFLAERDEKHQIERIDGVDIIAQDKRSRLESRLDNTALRSTLQAGIYRDWSTADRTSFTGSISVLQYDTPDSVNTDDRDELLISLSGRQEHRFSDFFTGAVTAEVTLAHMVYLKREKSANNNWNRIFRLMPELRYAPDNTFRMYNAFEVLANYTVFDFESVIPTIKSYSYRQVAFLDSTSYDISTRIGIDIYAHVRIFERGELRWREFAERPLQRIEEVTFSPQIRYTLEERWYFAIGFRSFAQKRFRYTDNVRQYESTFLSAGPTTAIQIRLSRHSFVEMRGWKEFQRISDGRIIEYSNVTMNVRCFL